MQNIPIRAIQTIQEPLPIIGDFSIRELGPLLKEGDLVQELHRHDFYYMLIVEKGEGWHEIDFIKYPVKDHSLFFMRPGQVHQHCLRQRSIGYLIAFTALNEKATYQLLRQATSVNYYSLTSAVYQQIQPLITHLLEESAERSGGHAIVIKAMIETILVKLIRQQSLTAPAQTLSYEQQKLDEFLALLEMHCQQLKQVSQYAALLNISTFQLNAITKATLGKTCSLLINERIILEAKQYLLATTNQVNQIAEYLGYEDASYFIRFFKKHTNFTPEAYRQNFA